MAWPRSVTRLPKLFLSPIVKGATALGALGLLVLHSTTIGGGVILVAAVILSFYGGHETNVARRSVWEQLDPLIDTLPPMNWSQEMVKMFQRKGWAVQISENPVVPTLDAVDPEQNRWIIHLLPPNQAITESLLSRFQPTAASPYVMMIARDRVPQEILAMASHRYHIKVWSRGRVRSEITAIIFQQQSGTPHAVAKTKR